MALPQARRYLLDLINRDRAALGKRPVELDEVASTMGQAQAEEMVKQGGMSHADRAGRLPVQRYTECGGKDRVRENVVVCRVRTKLENEIAVDPSPTFLREELDEIEAAYLNQVAPNDGHRQNRI